MHDMVVKAFLLIQSVKLPMEELSTVSATEILLVGKKGGNIEFGSTCMPKKFPFKSRSTRKLVSAIDVIKTYYNEVKSELYQTVTNSFGESIPHSENKVLAIYHWDITADSGLLAQNLIPTSSDKGFLCLCAAVPTRGT